MMVFGFMHYLVYKWMVLPSHFINKTKSSLRVILIVNYELVVCYLCSRFLFSVPHWLYFVCSLSIGVGFILFMGAVMHQLFVLVCSRTKITLERRRFLRRVGDVGLWSFGGIYSGVALYEGAREPIVEPITIRTKGLHKNYRFVQISDMHIGGLIGEGFVKKCVEKINSLNVDAVFITGDLVDENIETIKSSLKHLENIKSKLGVFFIVGNHEYFHDATATITHVESLGIKVLKNEAVEFEDFWLVGVYDLMGLKMDRLQPDIKKAVRLINNSKPTILLAHQPKFFKYLEGFEPDVMLSGHTHGGQLFPFHLLVRIDQPFLKGLHTVGKTQIYINSGIGFWGPPMRLGSYAEITLMEWTAD